MKVSLFMFKEDGESKEFPLTPGRTVIGRQEDCGLRIPLAEVSRRHAVLMVMDKSITLRDLGSSNGTYINNRKINEQELEAGDHIVIGPVVFTIQIDGEPEDVRPVRTRLEARKSAVAAADTEESDVLSANDLFSEDEDPIGELEALAETDDTAAMDLEDSDYPALEDSDT